MIAFGAATFAIALAAISHATAANVVVPRLAYVVTGEIQSGIEDELPIQIADSLVKAARPFLGTAVPMISATPDRANAACDSIASHHGAVSCDVVVLMHRPLNAELYEVVVVFKHWLRPQVVLEGHQPKPSTLFCGPPLRQQSAHSCRMQAFPALVTELVEHSQRTHLP